MSGAVPKLTPISSRMMMSELILKIWRMKFMILADITRRNGDIDVRVVIGDSGVSSDIIVAANMMKMAIQ